MGHMKELDRRIRQGGDDAIAAVGELLGCPSYSDSSVVHELREYAKKLAGRGCDDIAMAAELMRFAADYIDKIPSLRTQWIPVGERLPEEGAQVIVARRLRHWKDEMDTLIVSSWFEHEDFCGDEDDVPYSGVTHWMPLPEPPTE